MDRSDLSLDNFHNFGVTEWDGKDIFSLSGVVSQLSDGAHVKTPNGTITYSFLHTPVLHGAFNQGVGSKGAVQAYGLGPFSAAQEAAARQAIQMWDDLIAPKFVEKNGTGADIQFANNLDAGQAYAYRPTYDQGYKFMSDVFVSDPTYNMTNKWFSPGGYGNTTLIHEIGHTIGLSHPGSYNGTAEYGPDAEYAQDSTQFTIMSYFDQDNTGSYALNWNLLTGAYASDGLHLSGPVDPLINYAQTPQLHDIYTIQQLYGADPNTRSGETVYGFGSNAGLWVYDFAQNPYPAISIYDAGGSDTINASGFTVSQFIDLHAGSFSSIGAGPPTLGAAQSAAIAFYNETYSEAGGGGYFTGLVSTQSQIDEAFAFYSSAFGSFLADDTSLLGYLPGYEGTFQIDGLNTSQYQNVSIAYNTTIENAVGGQASDGILGNGANNKLDGQAGNDTLFGYAGMDTLIGGAGNDTLTGGADADKFVFANDGSTDAITDFATGVDKIDLSQVAGVTAADVTYNATTHRVEINIDHTGAADMFIVSTNVVNSGDYIFHA